MNYSTADGDSICTSARFLRGTPSFSLHFFLAFLFFPPPFYAGYRVFQQALSTRNAENDPCDFSPPKRPYAPFFTYPVINALDDLLSLRGTQVR